MHRSHNTLDAFIKYRAQKAFTLVELAVVLVLVALLVGGAIAGDRLIGAARQRAVIRNITDIQSAVQSFRLAYQAWPGDIPSTKATSLGFSTRQGTAGRGDGNGVVECIGGGASALNAGGETVLFWSDLSTSKMLSEYFPLATDQLVTAATALDVQRTIPATSLRSNSVAVYGIFPTNYLQVQGILKITNGNYTLTNDLTPQEAYALDLKIDDGNPTNLQGYVLARTGANNTMNDTLNLSGASGCVNAAGTGYNLAYTSGACGLRIQFSK